MEKRERRQLINCCSELEHVVIQMQNALRIAPPLRGESLRNVAATSFCSSITHPFRSSFSSAAVVLRRPLEKLPIRSALKRQIFLQLKVIPFLSRQYTCKFRFSFALTSTYHLSHRTESYHSHPGVIEADCEVGQDFLHELDLTEEIRFSNTGAGIDEKDQIDLLMCLFQLRNAALEYLTELLELVLCHRVFRGGIFERKRFVVYFHSTRRIFLHGSYFGI